MLVLELLLLMVNHTIDFQHISKHSNYLLILFYLKTFKNYSGHLVLPLERIPKKCEKPLLHEDVFEHHPTVIRGIDDAKTQSGFEEEDLILGVDPGQRIGLSIFYYGKEIESSFHSSVEELVFHIIHVMGGLRAKRKL